MTTYTKKQRRNAANWRLGNRARNDWGDGNLPAPWAEGDIVHVPAGAVNERMEGFDPGDYIVAYCPSIEEGDAWYVRLVGERSDGTWVTSNRLHVAFAGRVGRGWPDEGVDWMAGVELVETADPEGLAERERLLAEGWTMPPEPSRCPSCGQVLPPDI